VAIDYTKARGLLAMHGPKGLRPDAEKFAEAKQDFTVAMAVRRVQQTLDDGPPLSAERRTQLVADLTAVVVR
jgi:hypothetical protein